MFENSVQDCTHIGKNLFALKNESNRYGVIDNAGKVLLQSISSKLRPTKSGDLFIGRMPSTEKYGIFNRSAKLIIDTIYDSISDLERDRLEKKR